MALDALAAFVRYDTGLLMELQPRLEGAADGASFRQTLERYAQEDAVPRVKRAVAFLLKSADTIIENQMRGGRE